MNYIAVTETRPIEHYVDKVFTEADLEKLKEEFYKTPLIFEKQEFPIFPNYTTINLSEETFKFIESIAIISTPIFGEKEYKINDLKFQIYT